MPSPGGGEEEKTTRSTMVMTTGYNFSDVSTAANNPNNMVSQFQTFDSNTHQEIYGLDMIGFSSKNNNLHHHQPPPTHHDSSSSVMWKEFFGKSGDGPSSSSSKTTINHHHQPSDAFYHHHHQPPPDFSTTGGGVSEAAGWTHHDPCVFPCEGNDQSRPISSTHQGLSLSLGNTSNNLQIFQQEGLFGKLSAAAQYHHHHHGQFEIRSSKYLNPAQELLNEFCCLDTKQNSQKTHNPQWHEDQENATKFQSLYSLDLLELQKRKSKLLQMLEEVDRRYKHYCNQMRSVVCSFEEVAGNGAAKVYSALASKAMSRHFRCLRDGIVGQIKAIKKALGEKDHHTSTTSVAPGTTRGETPRLRLLDQTLRQQRAFQQMNMMESHPWRPQRGLPERAVSVLRAWLFEHFLHPYPSDVDKHILARQTGLSRSQVSNWFINARVRLWKPMVEEMYLEENKEQENIGSSDGTNSLDEINVSRHNHHQDDQKPTADQLVRIDSECLSSIINNPEKNDTTTSKNQLQDQELQGTFGRVTDTFGAIELDFSSYNQNLVGSSGGGGSVSLTLGLQQHGGGGGGGVSLAFSSAASQNSLFYGREHIEDCPPSVQYSLLDNEGQNLPYRNLMGAQLLHDLAG